MKKVMVYLLMVALLVSVFVPAARAEIRAEAVQEKVFDPFSTSYTISLNHKRIVEKTAEGYVLTDIQGNILSDCYSDIQMDETESYAQAYLKTDEFNNAVLLDMQGQVVIEEQYADFDVLSDKWVAGFLLELTDGDGYDKFTPKGKGIIQRVDLFYQGNRVASLSREEYGFLYAYGDYLFSAHNGNEGVFSSNGSFTKKPYAGEYIVDLKDNSIWHAGSGQQAFVPGCTLEKEEVEKYLLYDGQGNVLDLQGNVVLFLPEKPELYIPKVLTVYGDKYFIIDTIGEDYLCDLEQGVIYQDYEFDCVDKMAQTGYVLCQSQDGMLSYVDAAGNAVALGIKYKGVYYNNYFLYQGNEETGKYMVYSAAAGLLGEYDDVYISKVAPSKVLEVKKGEGWGAIDLQGNTVIDFEYNSISVCADTSYVIGLKPDNKTLILYQLTDADQTEADVPAEEDKEAAKLEAKAQRLEAKAARAMDKAAPLLEECAVIEDELATLEAQKATCEADLAYLDAEIAALQAEMVEQQADRMAEINALCISRDDVAAKLASCQIEIDHMKTQMEKLQTEADRLIAEAEAYLAEANALRLQAQNMLPAEIVSQSEEASETWHCDACNRDNDMNFCPGCGAKKPVKLVCSGCGYEPEAQDFRFCPQCGQSFN